MTLTVTQFLVNTQITRELSVLSVDVSNKLANKRIDPKTTKPKNIHLLFFGIIIYIQYIYTYIVQNKCLYSGNGNVISRKKKVLGR